MAFPITGTVDTKYAAGTIVGADGKIKERANDAMDKEAFLKLLVAQMKYQSPDKPVDSSQMMAQSAQFSILEALQNMAKDQTSLLSAQRSVTATSMLGQQITALPKIGDKDIVGVVTGVRLGTDGPVLKVGDMEVPLSSVKEVTKQ